MRPKKVTRWRCRDCYHLHESQKAALECCNEKLEKEKAEASKRKVKSRLAKLRIQVTKSDVRAACPYQQCKEDRRVTLKMNERWWSAVSLTREVRIRKAKALLRAQMARHLHSWSHRLT